MPTQVAACVARLGGPGGENAYHRLIEADDAIIPLLVDAFRREQDPAIRAQLVEVIWQHRLLQTVDFLAEALDDADPGVWKSALDGLVALGGPRARGVLKAARQHADPERVVWIDEAIEQIEGSAE